MHRKTISSDTPRESSIAVPRVVPAGTQGRGAGTPATDEDATVVGGGDSYRKTRSALSNVEATVQNAGTALADGVRSRFFVVDIDQREAAERVYTEMCGTIRPATSMLEVSRASEPYMLVEATAHGGSGNPEYSV